MQHCRQLLKVALWRTKHFMFSLKALSQCFLLKVGTKKENVLWSKGFYEYNFLRSSGCKGSLIIKTSCLLFTQACRNSNVLSNATHWSWKCGVYLSSCRAVVNSVLMDGFHVFYNVSRADGPAYLDINDMQTHQRQTTRRMKCGKFNRITFHPVALKVFPPLPMVMVLSHIPGRLAAIMLSLL